MSDYQERRVTICFADAVRLLRHHLYWLMKEIDEERVGLNPVWAANRHEVLEGCRLLAFRLRESSKELETFRRRWSDRVLKLEITNCDLKREEIDDE